MVPPEVVLMLLFVVGPILLVTLYLGKILLFRLQIHMVEMLVTLLASTMPLGAILNGLNRDSHAHYPEDWVKAVVVGCFPFVLFFAGSVWGLSAIKRLELARPWPRLGALAAGWGLVAAALAALPAIGCTLHFVLETYRNKPAPFSALLLPAVWGLVALGVPGLILEGKCRARALEREQLQKRALREELRAQREARQKTER